ncbi:hypothetical protein D5086_023338 [Populus alba]|uniref:Uncharacterized protein n=1 Tax=Populus alba TaxID=43335 RepID=A0ACC4BA40_POPAL
MVADNKGKKLKVAEKGEEDNNQIDEELILTSRSSRKIQDDLEKRQVIRFLEVEQKYNEIRKPVYDKRNEIIKSIPDFWLTAMFKFLSSLEVEDSKDVKSGYSITFGLPNGVSHENKGNKRLLADESFFSWFSNTQPKGMIDDMQDEDPDEEDFDGDEADEGDLVFHSALMQADSLWASTNSNCEKDGDDSEEEDDGQEEDDDDEEEDDDTGK